MDKHEKGIEVDRSRPDQPLPRWNGGYGGNPDRLPKVVQKLVHNRTLTAEEKAELLWRFYELDHEAKIRRRVVWAALLILFVLLVGGVGGYVAYAKWDEIKTHVDSWFFLPPK